LAETVVFEFNVIALIEFLLRIAPVAMEWAILLFPLAVYLLYLGMNVNRRPHPVAVRGDVSFLGLCLGLSSLLLFGPLTWFLAPFARQGVAVYFAAWAAYVVLLGLILLGVVRRQRRFLTIYNLDPDAISDLLREVLAEEAVDYQVTPGRLALAGGRQVLDIEGSDLWYSVTLTWRGPDQELRQRLETRLREKLASVTTHANPAATILSLWGTFLASFITAAVMLFLWYHRAIP
jgi:hypothetical protein